MDRMIKIVAEIESGEFLLIQKFVKCPVNITLGLTPEFGRNQILEDLKHIKGIVLTESSGRAEDFEEYLNKVRNARITSEKESNNRR